jgi:hypothetical protein
MVVGSRLASTCSRRTSAQCPLSADLRRRSPDIAEAIRDDGDTAGDEHAWRRRQRRVLVLRDGETMRETVAHVPFGWLIQIPFYLLELVVCPAA